MAGLILFSGLVVLVQAQDNDTTPPAAVSDLAVSTTTVSSITLTWTAPGDDGMVGTSTSYDLRYATTTITEDNWDLATQADNEPTPQIASSTETMTVSGLEESTTYYFAIKSNDEEDNLSDLSNVANGTTLTLEPEPEPEPEPSTTFEMVFTPKVFNKKSRGRWVTAHLFLPLSYRASQVDISTVELNDELSPDQGYKGINYFRKKFGIRERRSSNLVLKFSRAEFAELVGEATGDFEVTVTGEINGETFSASDTVRILDISQLVDDILVQATNTPEVYIIKNGKMRHIPTVQAFNRRGLGWQNIEIISQDELDAYSEDDLLKAEDSPAVFIICAGMKRHIPSPEVFTSYGFDWNDISIVSADELADYAEVNLIRTAGDVKVYLLAGGKKHWIPTIAVFNKHGYKWENVIIVNSTEANSIPGGDNVE